MNIQVVAWSPPPNPVLQVKSFLQEQNAESERGRGGRDDFPKIKRGISSTILGKAGS